MLEIRQIACQRGDRLLFSHLDFTVAPGELWRVAGANGSGKTSLLRLLAGLAQPVAGEIRWQTQAISRAREAFHGALCYLGHAPALHDLLSPRENLAFACATAGLASTPQARDGALIEFGLRAQLDLPSQVLSAGQRRRVGLARLAFATCRPLWILDEPFTALDVGAVAALAARIDAHCATGGSVVFSSHQDAAFVTPLRTLDVEAQAR